MPRHTKRKRAPVTRRKYRPRKQRGGAIELCEEEIYKQAVIEKKKSRNSSNRQSPLIAKIIAGQPLDGTEDLCEVKRRLMGFGKESTILEYLVKEGRFDLLDKGDTLQKLSQCNPPVYTLDLLNKSFENLKRLLKDFNKVKSRVEIYRLCFFIQYLLNILESAAGESAAGVKGFIEGQFNSERFNQTCSEILIELAKPMNNGGQDFQSEFLSVIAALVVIIYKPMQEKYNLDVTSDLLLQSLLTPLNPTTGLAYITQKDILCSQTP